MSTTLVLPDGVRLAHEDEIPGPEADRAEAWARVQRASITPGYTLRETTDPRLPFYAEVNVDAPNLWALFCQLGRGLLGPVATFVMSEIDDEPAPLGTAGLHSILELLDEHAYQLTHSGYIQYGLVGENEQLISEVFVTPTKHLNTWFRDRTSFQLILASHDLSQNDNLEFLDQYPRVTTPLSDEKNLSSDTEKLIEHLRQRIGELES